MIMNGRSHEDAVGRESRNLWLQNKFTQVIGIPKENTTPIRFKSKNEKVKEESHLINHSITSI